MKRGEAIKKSLGFGGGGGGFNEEGLAKEKMREVERRVKVIKDCRVPQGCQNPAVAISFPKLEGRNRCFICMSTFRWRMYRQDRIKEAMRIEVERGWRVQENTEMQCAEVETEIQIKRLQEQGILQCASRASPSHRPHRGRLILASSPIRYRRGRGRGDGFYKVDSMPVDHITLHQTTLFQTLSLPRNRSLKHH